MLSPQSYPELVARALVLDDEAFDVMVADDNPLLEGATMTAAIGLVAGGSLALGSLLTAATLPDPQLMLTTLLQGWQQLAAVISVPPETLNRAISLGWQAATVASGYAGGLSHLLPLVLAPALMLVWWLFFGLVAHGAGAAVGGTGSLHGTLGATALIAAPGALLIFNIIPFAGVSFALIAVWSLLIGYRAVEIAHSLPWKKAVVAVLIPYAAMAVILLLLALAFGAGVSTGGFQ